MKLHGLYFDFQIDSGDGDFAVVEFTLQEKLSELFTLTLSVVSDNPSHELSPFLLQKASLYVYSDGVLQRRIEGVITTFERGQSGVRRTFYNIVIRPSLWLLTLRQNSRIFHRKTTPQIIDTLFSEYSLAFDCRLSDEHKEREYTVQKRETDYDFVARLAAEEGITIWTQNLKGEPEKIFYSDGWQGLTRCCAIDYNVHPQNLTQGNFVYDLTFSASMTPQQMIGKDNTYLNPDYPFTHKAMAEKIVGDPALYAHFDSYGRFHFPAGQTGDNFARYRLEQLQINSEMGKAKSNSIKIRTGGYLKLHEHPDPKMNDDWQIIEAKHVGKMPQNMDEDSDGGGANLTNAFTFMHAGKHYRPPFRPKPIADGAETAIVCGPEEEEIFTNELGQVLVHFHWNRYDAPDDKASCWVRVAQGWNGGRYGFYAIPRIGQEVIITYLNGDIDKPVVTGCVYNEKHKPPLDLPGNKTQTILKSKMYKGQGYSQLVLDDTNNEVGTRLHSTPGATQLNMGFLVHPRNDKGVGEARGHGFELRTDEWGAIRAAKGLFISTDARRNAEGSQLDLEEAIYQLKSALDLAKSLAQATKTGKGLSADVKDQQKQLDKVFTGLQESGLLASAPEGIAITTPKSAQVSAETNITFTAGQNADISVAKAYRVAAGDAISLFSVEKDVKVIANKGFVELLAQHNAMNIAAQDQLKIISTDGCIEIEASQDIILRTKEGAYIKLSGSQVEIGGLVPLILKTGGFNCMSSASNPAKMPEYQPAEFDHEYIAQKLKDTWFSG